MSPAGNIEVTGSWPTLLRVDEVRCAMLIGWSIVVGVERAKWSKPQVGVSVRDIALPRGSRHVSDKGTQEA